jgi:polyhydroxyalkanoate synthesis regulator phasin
MCVVRGEHHAAWGILCYVGRFILRKAAPAMTDEKNEIGLIEKVFLMGVGAASLAKEKTEELAEELVSRGTITREESDTFVSRLLGKAEEAGKTAKSTVERETGKAVSGAGLASAKDVEDIRSELTEIKSLIAALRTQSGAGS